MFSKEFIQQHIEEYKQYSSMCCKKCKQNYKVITATKMVDGSILEKLLCEKCKKETFNIYKVVK